jgi:hypothetical protein
LTGGTNDDTSLPPVSGGNGGAGGGEGSAAGGGGTGGTVQLPCNIDAIMAKSCRSCHGTPLSYGAPIPLVTYADLTAPWKGGKVYEHVQQRVHAGTAPMPPAPNPLLDAAALAAIDAWVAAGAPPGTAACSNPGGGTSSNGPPPLPCTPDQKLRPASPGSIDHSTIDQYYCYGVDIPVTSDRHVIAIGPHLDNKAVLHHLLLFQSNTSVSPQATSCSGTGVSQYRLYGGWAPGDGNVILPEPAGVRETSTTHWMVQVHLNNTKGLPTQSDSSGFDFCTTDKLRPNDAEVMAFGTINISLPPRATVDIGCDFLALGGGVHIFGMSPHMHRLGKSMTTSIIRGGTEIPLANVSAWDFNAQSEYQVNADIQAGDVIRNHCVFNNTTDQTVTFGENTSNEMCFDFAMYYPVITSPLWTWMTPSILSRCQ